MAGSIAPDNVERNSKIMELYSQGLSYSEIAVKTGTCRNAVAGVVHRSGGGDRGGVKRPRQHMVGRTFGRLKVLSHAGVTIHGHRVYLCFCSCGIYKKVSSNALLAIHGTRSCGCLNQERLARQRKVDAEEVIRMHRKLKWSPMSIAQALGLHYTTVYRTLRRSKEMAA